MFRKWSEDAEMSQPGGEMDRQVEVDRWHDEQCYFVSTVFLLPLRLVNI